MSVVFDFNKTVNNLILRVERKTRNDEESDNLDRLQKRISVLKYAGGADVLIENSASIICEYNKYITNNDDQFFIQLNVRNEVSKKGGVVKDSDNFIYSLIDSVREHYLKSTTKEKQDIFKEINVLLQCSARYLSGEK